VNDNDLDLRPEVRTHLLGLDMFFMRKAEKGFIKLGQKKYAEMITAHDRRMVVLAHRSVFQVVEEEFARFVKIMTVVELSFSQFSRVFNNVKRLLRWFHFSGKDIFDEEDDVALRQLMQATMTILKGVEDLQESDAVYVGEDDQKVFIIQNGDLRRSTTDLIKNILKNHKRLKEVDGKLCDEVTRLCQHVLSVFGGVRGTTDRTPLDDVEPERS
jgi:hypothetical protein